MAAHQAAPSLGFSRQEHWSGLPFPSPVLESEKWKWSHSVVSDSQRPHGLQPARLLSPWDFPGTGVGCWLCYKFCDSHYPLLRFSNSLGWLTKLRKKHCLHLQMCQKGCNSERAKCKRCMGGCGELPCPSMPFLALPCPSMPSAGAPPSWLLVFPRPEAHWTPLFRQFVEFPSPGNVWLNHWHGWLTLSSLSLFPRLGAEPESCKPIITGIVLETTSHRDAI